MWKKLFLSGVFTIPICGFVHSVLEQQPLSVTLETVVMALSKREVINESVSRSVSCVVTMCNVHVRTCMYI